MKCTYNHFIIQKSYITQHSIQWKRFLSKLVWKETLLTPLISFLLDVFENLIVGLHVLIIFFMFAKFQENQRSITLLSIKCLNFKFLWFKFMHKNKFIDRIVNNIRFKWNLTCMLRTQKTYNSIIRFQNFTSNKKI